MKIDKEKFRADIKNKKPKGLVSIYSLFYDCITTWIINKISETDYYRMKDQYSVTLELMSGNGRYKMLIKCFLDIDRETITGLDYMFWYDVTSSGYLTMITVDYPTQNLGRKSIGSWGYQLICKALYNIDNLFIVNQSNNMLL